MAHVCSRGQFPEAHATCTPSPERQFSVNYIKFMVLVFNLQTTSYSSHTLVSFVNSFGPWGFIVGDKRVQHKSIQI